MLLLLHEALVLQCKKDDVEVVLKVDPQLDVEGGWVYVTSLAEG